MNALRRGPGRIACRIVLHAVSEGVQGFVLMLKDLLWKTNFVHVWPGSKGNDRETDLNSRQF